MLFIEDKSIKNIEWILRNVEDCFGSVCCDLGWQQDIETLV